MTSYLLHKCRIKIHIVIVYYLIDLNLNKMGKIVTADKNPAKMRHVIFQFMFDHDIVARTKSKRHHIKINCCFN